MEKHYQEKDIILNLMGDSASEQFSAITPDLDILERGFHSKTDNHTLGELLLKLLGNLCWGLLIWVFWKYWPYSIPKPLMIATIVNLGLLVCSILVDNSVRCFYFNKIDRNRTNIAYMKKQVGTAQESIVFNDKNYMKACENGWDYPLSQVNPIPEQIDVLEKICQSYQMVESMWMGRIINALFFSAAIMLTVATGYSMLKLAYANIQFLSDLTNMEVTMWVCRISLALACAAEAALAWLCWSKNNCKVDNILNMILLIAPILFLLLSFLLGGIVWSLVWIVSGVLVVLYYGLMFGCATAICAGSSN